MIATEIKNRRQQIREKEARKNEALFWEDIPLSSTERTKCDKSNFWDKNFILDKNGFRTFREVFDGPAESEE